MDKNYTIVAKLEGNDYKYLIVRLSDSGHYVVAETFSREIANTIMNALEAEANKPGPF